MGVEKMSVSFELDLGEAIRMSAGRGQQSVSAWLAEAARDRLRLEALAEAMTAWEGQYGALTDAEVSEADQRLTHPAAGGKPARRRRGAA